MKRGIIISLAFFYLSSVFLVSGAGVTPASYNIDFEPNFREEFVFTFIFPPYVKSDVYISGSLGEYAEVIKEQEDLVNGRKRVVVELNLPEEVDRPGVNTIRVGALEQFGGEGIAIGSDVGGLIRVRVPYPGKYAELSLKTSNANAGERVPYELTVYSRGRESIDITTKLEITNADGYVKTINLDNRHVKSRNNTVYRGFIDSTNLNPGDYNLTALVDYGDDERIAEVSSLFRLGELNVRLVNYTREITAGKINRFAMEIESLWNEPMKEVYGEMTIIGYPDVFLETPTISLSPWRKTFINGFIDATDIRADVVLGEITLYFDGESKSEIVEINVIKPINWILILLIAGGVFVTLLILLMFIIIVVLLLKRKK